MYRKVVKSMYCTTFVIFGKERVRPSIDFRLNSLPREAGFIIVG